MQAGDKVHEVSAAVEKEIQNQKIWKSTCDWMKKNVLENAKAFTDDVKKLLDEAVVSRVKGWLDNGKAQILYKYQNLKGDDIYAELKNLMDEDAFDYLQKEFYYHNVDAHPNQLKLLEDTADCIKAAQEIKSGNLTLDETKYVYEKIAGKISGEKANKIFHFLAGKDFSDILDAESFQYLKNKYSDASSFERISKIIDSAVSESEVKGKCLNLSDIRYLVKAVTAKVSQKTINEMIEGTSPRKTYYTVQDSKDVQRLLGSGTPWKTGSTEAHFGEGIYAWGNRRDAEAYLDICLKRGAKDTKIMEFEVLESDFSKMRQRVLVGCSDDEVNEFLEKYSTLINANSVKKHNYDYISRSAGMGDEYYFNKTIFTKLRFK